MKEHYGSLSAGETARWTNIGELSALALLLSYLETFVPIPIPGVKLGLANIAVLIALFEGDVSGAFFVGAIKVLATGLLFGNPVMMAYSIAGTLLAFAVMAPLSRLDTMHIVMVSVAGAIAHEVGQLLVAMTLLGTPLVWYSSPALLVAGCVTGAFCGVIASRVSASLAQLPEEHVDDVPGPVMEHSGQPSASSASNGSLSDRSALVNPKVASVAFIAFTLVLLLASNLIVLIGGLLLALVACFAFKASPVSIARTLKPTALIAIITVIAQIASSQTGDVAFTVGGVSITYQALMSSLAMIVRLLAIVCSSIALVSAIGEQNLVSATTWFLSPLKRVGLKPDGFSLALSVALATLPVLMASFESRTWSWKSWREELPRFIAQARNGN